jgi:TIR domain
MTNKSHAVFLSYNDEDRAAVEKIAVYLADKANLHPWFDQWALIPGEPWVLNLERGLANSSSCAVFVGKSGQGPWQTPEVEAALREQVRDPGFRVIPVLLPDAPQQPKLPIFLTGNTWSICGRASMTIKHSGGWSVGSWVTLLVEAGQDKQ